MIEVGQMTRWCLTIVLLLILYMFLPTVQAYEDEAYFAAPNAERYLERTDVAYVNEDSYSLFYRFGHNLTKWCVEMESPLFLRSIFGATYENVEAGMACYSGLDLNPEASPGEYTITVYLNYTTDSGMNVSKEFNLVVEYRKVIEVVDVVLPTTENKTMSLTVETFYPLSELKVNFRAMANIHPETEEVVLKDVEPGIYYFQTQIIKPPYYEDLMEVIGFEILEPQSVGYSITSAIGGRDIEIYESNIGVKVDMDDTGGVSDNDGKGTKDKSDSLILVYKWPIIIALLVFLFIFNYSYFFYKKK